MLQELESAQQNASMAGKTADARMREAGPSAPANLHDAHARLAGLLHLKLLATLVAIQPAAAGGTT